LPGGRPNREKVVKGLASVLDLFDADEARTYTYMAVALASKATRGLLEKIMTAANIPFNEWAQMVLPKTWAKGIAESVLAILAARSIVVPADVRERITTCTDPKQLDAWIARAATATKIEDLFG
jgi:hypothetical protein